MTRTQYTSLLQKKLDYIHNNPVTAGYVAEPHHWLWSSARDYLGENGLLEIDRIDCMGLM